MNTLLRMLAPATLALFTSTAIATPQENVPVESPAQAAPAASVEQIPATLEALKEAKDGKY